MPVPPRPQSGITKTGSARSCAFAAMCVPVLGQQQALFQSHMEFLGHSRAQTNMPAPQHGGIEPGQVLRQVLCTTM